MDARDKARTDLYLAQLRTQSAPNTPGFGSFRQQMSRTPGFPSLYTQDTKTSDDHYSAAEEGRARSPAFASPESATSSTSSPFKLQAPPVRVHNATPNPESYSSFAQERTMSPPPPEERIHDHVAAAPGEQTYDAVPIPGAYAPPTSSQQGQAF
jgi:hypothetical protein